MPFLLFVADLHQVSEASFWPLRRLTHVLVVGRLSPCWSIIVRPEMVNLYFQVVWASEWRSLLLEVPIDMRCFEPLGMSGMLVAVI